MLLEEVYDKSWNISKDVNIKHTKIPNIPKEEQECHFNVLKEGYNKDESEITFDCSFQEWITKLSKSKLCTITNILVSSNINHKDYVLQVAGKLLNKTLTIRKSMTTMSEENKKAMTERMHALRAKTKQQDNTNGGS